MVKHTFKILRCSHRKIFKVCLTILQHYEKKGYRYTNADLKISLYVSVHIKIVP